MSDVQDEKNRGTPIRDYDVGGAPTATSLEQSRFATHRLLDLIVLAASAIDAAGCVWNSP